MPPADMPAERLLAVCMVCFFAPLLLLRAEDPSTFAAKSSSGRTLPAPLPANEKRLNLPDKRRSERVLESVQSGAEWLARGQNAEGKFQYGWLPALNRPMPGDHPLRQAGSAAALARTAALLQSPEFRCQAKSAILRLIRTHTKSVDQSPPRRASNIDPADANPVGFCALLLWATVELDDDDIEIAEASEALARFIVRRQRADGSIDVSTGLREDLGDSFEAQAYYPGEALFALMRSQLRRPEAWKIEAVHKAFPYYRNYWHRRPHEAFAPWMCAAFAEAYRVSQRAPYADFVFEMADWMLVLQHRGSREAEAGWEGGFGSFQDGHAYAVEPSVASASFCEGLVEAYRTAALKRDRTREESYGRALDLGVDFLMGLQFTPERTQHFNADYARRLHGGFRAGLSDAALRIDQNQHAINALLQYSEFVLAPASRRRPQAGSPAKNTPTQTLKNPTHR